MLNKPWKEKFVWESWEIDQTWSNCTLLRFFQGKNAGPALNTNEGPQDDPDEDVNVGIWCHQIYMKHVRKKKKKKEKKRGNLIWKLNMW